RRRPTTLGEVLYDAGDNSMPCRRHIRRAAGCAAGAGNTLIATHAHSQFSGECAVVTGRSSIFRVHVSEPGEVIQLDRDELLNLVQTDAELSEILLGAFLQRRLGLIAGSLGDVVVLGSMHDSGTL